MKKAGTADLPLHHGFVPLWLAERMAKLGRAIVEEILAHQGKNELLSRLSDPFWFQSLGAVMGMDWHSSGITTSVMGALKRSINPNAKEFGLYICGGKGNQSKLAPTQLLKYAESNGLDGNSLVRSSKLSAKVDNTAVQDGFQLYQHHFVVSNEGNWTVIQQGMSNASATARRYHWHAPSLRSFTEEPHTFVYGENCGAILNLTDKQAQPLKQSIMGIASESPVKMLAEIEQVKRLVMPNHHDVRAENIDMKRLGAVLWLAQERNVANFEELLLLEGLGPRTLQSLALVSEVIHGSPSRFKDPARFSFAHGGKDGHPFPVPTKVYDETIATLQNAIYKSKLGRSEQSQAIKALSKITASIEDDFVPNGNFEELIAKERADSWKYGGRTVFGKAKPPVSTQLALF
ncbi:DUF763 domain-containing protein [Pedobacter sp. KR3-3]|uniref:DUF763 domain-containing protein n=1 Tax=Pedobacter albus TaxID=3113905 RepID=A0ABU7I4B9_9SPHI|nr:DUF763 domain-containing protein [Pedobacter sp. KR3-3]MEE1944307.1 DUF763 domain-containing protein [Pedobacter sp. KR3-3]